MRITIVSIVLAGFVFAAAGCGGSSSESSDAAGLRIALEQTGKALIAKDAKALYGRFSKDCRQRVKYSEFAPWVVLADGAFKAFYGVQLKDLRVQSAEARNVENGRGEGTIAYVAKDDSSITIGGDEWEPYVYEDGAWHTKDCSGFEDAG